jgi:putative colanic acid biosynthesis UDP-glucose lipid carrier transferase
MAMTMWASAREDLADKAAGDQLDFRSSKRAWNFHSIIPLAIAFEFAFLGVAAYLGSSIYHQATHGNWAPFEQSGSSAIFVAALVMLTAMTLRQFVAIQVQPRVKFVLSGLSAVAVAFVLLLSTLFFLKIAEGYSRGAFALQFVFVCAAICFSRVAIYYYLQTALAHGSLEAKRIVLIGNEDQCATFIDAINTPGLRTIASLASPTDRDASGPRPFVRIVALCRTVSPDDAVIVSSHQDMATARRLAHALSELPIGVHIFDVEAAGLLAAARLVSLGNAVTLQVSRPPLSPFDRAVKRTFDLIVGTVCLLVAAPLLALAALAIRLESPGPVLFRQTRHGLNNRVIRVFKLRTMSQVETPDAWRQAVPGDKRVTHVGAVLRRLSIDELPQLLNVLGGEMSIVGPRPHLTVHNHAFEPKIAELSRRHRVKPGITGWAQVNGYRGQTDMIEKMQRRVEHDLFYIEHWSLFLDAKILIMTLFSKKTYNNAV